MEVSPFYEKKIDCINCKKQFPTFKVRSKSVKVERSDSDFMPHYLEGAVNAMYYNVFVCEHCGFTFTEDFNKYFAPGVKEDIANKISAHWVTRDFNGERSTVQAIQAYQLALLCATVKKEKQVILAGLALRIAWMFRSLQNDPQERRFIKLSRNYYTESYSNEDYASTQMSEARITYMIAELSRRIEDYDTATRFFSRVIEDQRNGGEAKLLDMAKEQWELVRQARKQTSM